MNEAHENPGYLELDSVKTCSRKAVKKRQAAAALENECQRDMVFLRRMLLLMSTVAVIALLAAGAALFLAISETKGKHSYRGVLINLRGRQLISIRICRRNNHCAKILNCQVRVLYQKKIGPTSRQHRPSLASADILPVRSRARIVNKRFITHLKQPVENRQDEILGDLSRQGPVKYLENTEQVMGQPDWFVLDIGPLN